MLRVRQVVVLGWIALAPACAERREQPTVPVLVTWKADVAPIVATQCLGCHTGATAAGHYDLTSYNGALGGGSDMTPNAIAGDDGSQLIATLEGVAGTHAGFAAVLPVVRAWVVDSNLAYETSRIHDPGLLDPANPRFHGTELRVRGWKFALCQKCHGEFFDGTRDAPSCKTCHTNGPTACGTCHAMPPAQGAHARHAAIGLECGACHHVPGRWDEPGHILDNSGVVDPSPAEVNFGGLANRDVAPPRRTAEASYDGATGTCSAVYCHGGVLGDPTATHSSPVWTAGPTQAACGSCHGAPPANHAQSECAVCHPSTSASHIDAVIEVGNGSSTCTGCHGSGTQPAPPRGLHGELFTVDLAVGAHRAHLEANRLRGPIACAECHVVPATVGAAGHIDSALPAELTFGTLARTDSATPAWDRMSATCSSVYCHGGGTRLAAEPSLGKLASPSWIASGSSQIYCGACHGIPPSDAFHAPTLTLSDCATCHPSVDGFGNIVLTGPPDALTSEHINGTVDVQ